MKIGVMSDIHGNLPALTSVINAADEEGIKVWCVLGDLVGYYYCPAEVVSIIRELDGYAIAGNHDRMTVSAFLGNKDLDVLQRKYGSGHRVAVKQLDSVQMDWLAGLPDTRDFNMSGRSVHLCHGAPWDPIEYIYPDAPASTWQKFGDVKFNVIFYGHSHYANARFVGETLVVNPGSVGQPRDRKGGAQWAIWDSEYNSVELRRESYDVGRVQDMCRLHDPHMAYLCDVLEPRAS